MQLVILADFAIWKLSEKKIQPKWPKQPFDAEIRPRRLT